MYNVDEDSGKASTTETPRRFWSGRGVSVVKISRERPKREII